MAKVGNLGTLTTFTCGLRIVGIRSAVRTPFNTVFGALSL